MSRTEAQTYQEIRLRFLLWFLAGVSIGAIGWVVSVRVGDDAAGVLVGAVIVTAAAVGEFLSRRI